MFIYADSVPRAHCRTTRLRTGVPVAGHEFWRHYLTELSQRLSTQLALRLDGDRAR